MKTLLILCAILLLMSCSDESNTIITIGSIDYTKAEVVDRRNSKLGKVENISDEDLRDYAKYYFVAEELYFLESEKDLKIKSTLDSLKDNIVKEAIYSVILDRYVLSFGSSQEDIERIKTLDLYEYDIVDIQFVPGFFKYTPNLVHDIEATALDTASLKDKYGEIIKRQYNNVQFSPERLQKFKEMIYLGKKSHAYFDRGTLTGVVVLLNKRKSSEKIDYSTEAFSSVQRNFFRNYYLRRNMRSQSINFDIGGLELAIEKDKSTPPNTRLYTQNNIPYHFKDFSEKVSGNKPARHIDLFIRMVLMNKILEVSFESDSLYKSVEKDTAMYMNNFDELYRKKAVSIYANLKLIQPNTIPVEQIEKEFKAYFKNQSEEFKEKNSKKYATLFFEYKDKRNMDLQLKARDELLDSLMKKYNVKIYL